jgi:hypothetical protein
MMKITKQLLKEMILKEMASANPRHERKYDRIMNALRGKTHQSVAIMSGQNPMATASESPPHIKAMGNYRLKDKLEKSIAKMGLKYERIGGKFEGIIEDSVLIWDPSQPNSSPENHKVFLDKIAAFNRQHTQWGFVGGRRFTDNVSSQMVFTMYEIDYDSKWPNAYGPSRSFSQTTQVLDDSEMTDQQDNYSFDPTSGDKMGIPLKWSPRPEDQEALEDEKREEKWKDKYYKRRYNV